MKSRFEDMEGDRALWKANLVGPGYIAIYITGTYAQSLVNLVRGVVGADQVHTGLDSIHLLGIRHNLEGGGRAGATSTPGNVDELGPEIAHSLDAIVQIDHSLLE